MQRKSNILRPYTKTKNGIAMLIAIAFLLITAVLMAIMVNMTAQTTKRTADAYLQEQAHLLAKSATEFALLAVSARDRNINGCINQINITGPSGNFDINTTIRYIGLSGLGGTCSGTGSFIDTIVTPESNGTILIDTYVTSTAIARVNEQIRFHRRTMQKP
jgi:hypothetical protein